MNRILHLFELLDDDVKIERVGCVPRKVFAVVIVADLIADRVRVPREIALSVEVFVVHLKIIIICDA